MKNQRGAFLMTRGLLLVLILLAMLVVPIWLKKITTAKFGNWSGGVLAATTPVMGAVLQSRKFADARCEKEFGTGWRMADITGVGGGWTLTGHPGLGLSLAGITRYWVAIETSKANCWDSPP